MSSVSEQGDAFRTLEVAQDTRPSPITTRRRRQFRPVRLLFIGQSEYFAKCALSRSEWASCSFVHFRYGIDQQYIVYGIQQFQPDVVICFRPEVIHRGLLRTVPALTLGFTTEPVPRQEGDRHEDLLRRLGYLSELDISNFDRIVHFDALSVDFLRSKGIPVWKAQPLPLDWSLYSREVPLWERDGAIFVGRGTPYRDRFLDVAKRDFNIKHLAHGVDGHDLCNLLSHAIVGINVHNEDYAMFENRVLYHFACGNLVVTQSLSPSYGLEDQEDHIQFNTPDQLYSILDDIFKIPTLYEGIRHFGVAKAKVLFDSNHVYKRLIDELFWDVKLYGRRAAWN